jgi:hypothetical protein
MEGPGDNISEVGSTFRILHEAAMTSVRFSSISDEVQYNHAVWTILRQLQQELTLILHTTG